MKDIKTKLDALKSAAAGLRDASTWAEAQTRRVAPTPRASAVARTGGAPIGGYAVRVTQLAASAQKTYALDASSGGRDAADARRRRRRHGPVTVDIAAGAKIADVASAINGRGASPVYAAVVGGDKLVLSARATGAAVRLQRDRRRAHARPERRASPASDAQY